MKDNAFIHGLLIALAFLATVMGLNFFKASIHGDFQQMLLPIICGTRI
jgi:hypothetical protein